MSKQLKQWLAVWMLCICGCANAGSAVVNPDGLWTTISDRTNAPRAVVKMTTEKGVLQGKILKVFREPGDRGVCVLCPGKLKNKPIEGLTVVWGLKQAKNGDWSQGKILDPKSGKIYRCKLSMSEDGKTLNVRGYIGISLFGRTQKWLRRDKV